MSNQIQWNVGQMEQEYVKLNAYISNLKQVLGEIDALNFTNSNGNSAIAVENYKLAMRQHVESRLAYMENMVLVLKAKGQEFNTVDKESVLIGAGATCAPLHMAK